MSNQSPMHYIITVVWTSLERYGREICEANIFFAAMCQAIHTYRETPEGKEDKYLKLDLTYGFHEVIDRAPRTIERLSLMRISGRDPILATRDKTSRVPSS
jgi:hypothetical protein